MTIALALVAMATGQVSALPQETPADDLFSDHAQFAGPVSWVWFLPQVAGDYVQDFGALDYSVTCFDGKCSGFLKFTGVLGHANCMMTNNQVTGSIDFRPTPTVDECIDMGWTAPFAQTDPSLGQPCGGTGSAQGNEISGRGGGYGFGSC